MPGGRPFLRSASFCGNSGTMKASLVSAACEAVDAMKIARAKVAEIAKDLARPTVMHMVCSCCVAPAPRGAFLHRDESLHASRGWAASRRAPALFQRMPGTFIRAWAQQMGASATFSHGCDCARRGAVQPYLKP